MLRISFVFGRIIMGLLGVQRTLSCSKVVCQSVRESPFRKYRASCGLLSSAHCDATPQFLTERQKRTSQVPNVFAFVYSKSGKMSALQQKSHEGYWRMSKASGCNIVCTNGEPCDGCGVPTERTPQFCCHWRSWRRLCRDKTRKLRRRTLDKPTVCVSENK